MERPFRTIVALTFALIVAGSLTSEAGTKIKVVKLYQAIEKKPAAAPTTKPIKSKEVPVAINEESSQPVSLKQPK